jgi:hypothetical protein
MNFSDIYPNKYFKHADLNGKRRSLKIDRVELEVVGQDSEEKKAVLYFIGERQGFVLNKTNGLTVAEALGTETDFWRGATVVLFPTRTSYAGRQVDCVRVEVPLPAPAVPPATDKEGA